MEVRNGRFVVLLTYLSCSIIELYLLFLGKSKVTSIYDLVLQLLMSVWHKLLLNYDRDYSTYNHFVNCRPFN